MVWDHSEKLFIAIVCSYQKEYTNFMTNKGKLTLKRFNGIESFVISKAEIYAWESDGKISLNLEIETEMPLLTLPDTKGLKALPNAEITIYLEALNPDDLVGKSFEVENGMNEEIDEWDGRFYYCEHADLNKNTVCFISKDDNLFEVKWSGITQDVNFYDGSKPDTEVTIEAVFVFGEISEWQGRCIKGTHKK